MTIPNDPLTAGSGGNDPLRPTAGPYDPVSPVRGANDFPMPTPAAEDYPNGDPAYSGPLGDDRLPTAPGAPAPVVPRRVEEDRSLGEIMGDISQDLSTLMRQEVELARAELSETASRAGKGAGMFAGAGVAGWFTLLFLSVALWWALGTLVGLGWSAVIVAVIWAIVAAILAVTGRNEMARVRGLPKTAETVSKIPNALKGNEEDNR